MNDQRKAVDEAIDNLKLSFKDLCESLRYPPQHYLILEMIDELKLCVKSMCDVDRICKAIEAARESKPSTDVEGEARTQ